MIKITKFHIYFIINIIYIKKYTYNKNYKKSKRLSRKKGGSAKRENDRFSKEIRDLEFEKEKFIRESEDYISASEKLSKALE